MTAVESGAVPVAANRRWKVGARTVFFGILLVVFACYVQLALGMEWRTAAGRIGPGFFPRIIGGVGVVLTVVALVRSVRRAEPETESETETDGPDLGRHPRTMAIVVGASVALAAVFTVLGAVVAGALFLLGCLWLLNREHPVLNAVLGVGLAVGLYLLFQTLLNAGLPAGVLPF
ncbi:tripartite tricarboxylate transporter TctB family protein [Pseudonocardia sp. DLS-67]